MNYLPCEELLEILKPAYEPCKNFNSTCKDKISDWNPQVGHIPRGFCGAIGKVSEVDLVLVVAEPGNPKDDESYSFQTNIEDYFNKVSGFVYECYEKKVSDMHINIRDIVDKCFPNISLFSEQVKKIWITETVLCSAKVSTGPVDASCEQACVNSYFKKQMDLFENSFFIIFGGKAKKRIKHLFNEDKNNSYFAHHVAPPGVNIDYNKHKDSWDKAISKFLHFMDKKK